VAAGVETAAAVTEQAAAAVVAFFKVLFQQKLQCLALLVRAVLQALQVQVKQAVQVE
jgi:hypothetical protein